MRAMTRGAAINAKCRDCIHDPAAPGTWREQVAQCSALRCPLWTYRPAPSGGPFADPPRNPATVTREWLQAPLGCAVQAIGGTLPAGPATTPQAAPSAAVAREVRP